MGLMERGIVRNGGVVFPKPLPLPEGSEVTVYVEPAGQDQQRPAQLSEKEYVAQPFFGLWRDREDMRDSMAWVRGERAKWQQRLSRQD